MSLLLDAGALIAFERGNRLVQAFLERAHRRSEPVRTTSTVVAQIWRKPKTQVHLGRLLQGVEELGLDRVGARRVGLLLGAAKLADVVDASLIDAAYDGDEILTSDPGDLLRLANAAGKRLRITPV